ncbi:DUF6011 domain-containing protein [[Mycobacterium] zoologicum]|uniref:DUF6011 domain-containing protein n=1 Tax=[Mycobacterium] zoologicum TaxID=2872311 RepID=UPI001CD5AD69
MTDAELIAEAERRGLILGCRCDCCSRPLTAAASVERGRGPVCDERAGVSA